MNTHTLRKFFTVMLLIMLLPACSTTAANSTAPHTPTASSSAVGYWPSNEWRTSTPEEQGMDSELLANMLRQVEDQQLNLHSLLIVRHGYLVTEAYFDPYTQDQQQYIASITKSVISTLVGIAIEKGYIQDVNQTLVSFFPGRTIANLDVRKQAITLEDLLTLTAGLECSDNPFSDMQQSSDWVQFMLDAPTVDQPGTKFFYCGGAVHLLSAILQTATGMSAREFANRYLFEPIGIPQVPDTRWQADPQGISIGPAGLYLTPRDLARLGYLYLQNGRWGDQQILPLSWIKAATAIHTTKDNGLGYGYLWTVDPVQGSYSALGYAGQEIYVIPSSDMVIVFTGTLPSDQPDKDFLPLKALVDNYILPAVKSEQALSANGTAFAKFNTFVREAANPKQVASIPEGALQWSGVVYQMDPNPVQWDTISFEIQPGVDSITVTLNGQEVDPPIGFDNLYRIQNGEDIFAPEAMRGTWENDHTLFVQLIYLGELNDSEIQIDFSPEDVSLDVKDVVSGQVNQLHGKRIAPSPTPLVTPIGGGTGQFVFSSNRGGDYDDLYVLNLDGSGLTRLTPGDGNYFAGPWSPDGRKILYTGFGLTHSYVGVMNADGTDQIDLSQQPDSDEGFPVWSPDGKQIAFTSRRDGNNEIYIVDADGANPIRLTQSPGDDFAPAWSPDGGQIVFVSDRDRTTGVYSLYLMSPDGSNIRRLADIEGSTYSPAWSPDGSQIAFRSDLDGAADICVINVDGSGLRCLTKNQGANWAPSWSPDGGQIIYQTNRDGNWEIYLMNADGSNPRNLTQNPSDDQYPYFEP